MWISGYLLRHELGKELADTILTDRRGFDKIERRKMIGLPRNYLVYRMVEYTGCDK